MTRSVSPMWRPSRRSFSARPPGRRRDSVSPCSSRSTIALCSSRSRWSAPSVPAETPSASLTNTASTSASTASGGRPLGGGDRLDRLALGHHAEQLLLGGRQAPVRSSPAGPARRRWPGRARCRRSPRRGWRRRAGRPGRCGPSGGSRSRPSPRPAARRRTRGRRTARGSRRRCPGWRLRTSLAASMPSRLKAGGIRMSVTRTWGWSEAAPSHHLVVVGRHPDDPEVLVPLDEGPHTLADDEVVVGQEDRDRARAGSRCVIHRL